MVPLKPIVVCVTEKRYITIECFITFMRRSTLANMDAFDVELTVSIQASHNFTIWAPRDGDRVIICAVTTHHNSITGCCIYVSLRLPMRRTRSVKRGDCRSHPWINIRSIYDMQAGNVQLTIGVPHSHNLAVHVNLNAVNPDLLVSIQVTRMTLRVSR